MAKPISIQLNHVNSRVDVGWGCLSGLGSLIRNQISGSRLVMVTQSSIPDGYIQTVAESCRLAGFTVHTLCISDGEVAKSLDEVASLMTQLLTWRLDRHDALIAIGGGVVGDLTGFAAAIKIKSGFFFFKKLSTLS